MQYEQAQNIVLFALNYATVEVCLHTTDIYVTGRRSGFLIGKGGSTFRIDSRNKLFAVWYAGCPEYYS